MRLEAGANRCLSETRFARPRGLEPLTDRVSPTRSHEGVRVCGTVPSCGELDADVPKRSAAVSGSGVSVGVSVGVSFDVGRCA